MIYLIGVLCFISLLFILYMWWCVCRLCCTCTYHEVPRFVSSLYLLYTSHCVCTCMVEYVYTLTNTCDIFASVTRVITNWCFLQVSSSVMAANNSVVEMDESVESFGESDGGDADTINGSSLSTTSEMRVDRYGFMGGKQYSANEWVNKCYVIWMVHCMMVLYQVEPNYRNWMVIESNYIYWYTHVLEWIIAAFLVVSSTLDLINIDKCILVELNTCNYVHWTITIVFLCWFRGGWPYSVYR